MKNNLTQHVPSLELCKQLRDAGYPQEGSCFYWQIVEDNHNVEPKIINYYHEPKSGVYNSDIQCVQDVDDSWKEYCVAAPLASELLERLPGFIAKDGLILGLEIKKYNGVYNVCYRWVDDQDNGGFEDLDAIEEVKEVDALAKMYLYLSKNNLLEESDAK
jgi:hypothetical protein